MATVSQRGLDLIKSFEGCRLTSYQDPVGIWTIGYGHTGADVTPNMTIAQDLADAWLAQDLAATAKGVEDSLWRPISQLQFDALCSFAYNVGVGAFKQSTLLRFVDAGNFQAAADQFRLWVHAGSEVLPGLVRRRAAEAALFLEGSQAAA